LSGIAAEAAAVPSEIGHQPDLVVCGPAREEPAEAAMLVRDAFDERGIVAHRPDLLRIANDPAVRRELFPEIVGLEQQPLRLESEESLFEAGPLLLDDSPHETGCKDTLCHR